MQKLKSRRFTPFLIVSVLLHMGFFMLMPVATESRSPVQNDLFDVDFVPQVIAAKPAVATLPQKTKGSRPDTDKSAGKASDHHIKPGSDQNHAANPEATVSLNSPNSKDRKYNSYLAHLRSKIDSRWEYPADARHQDLEGTLTLRFAIDSAGSLGDIILVSSSHQPVLDQEAVRTVQAASPFKPLPASFALSRLNVLATFTYQYQSD